MNDIHHHSETHHVGHALIHGSAQDFLRRFWIVSILLVPLAFTNEMVSSALGIGMMPFSRWVGFGIATAIFSFSLVFFRHARHEMRARRYGMMTLVALAVGAGYVFSAVSTFIPSLGVEFYLEIATLIWVLLFGHYLEARSSSAAGDALSAVAVLLPKEAHRLVGGTEEAVSVEELRVGDTVLVKPGEKMPADGTVRAGGAQVDESLISGESAPVAKKEGDTVVAGSVCLDGSLSVALTRVGEHSTVGQIRALVAHAQTTKPNAQHIADRAAALLTGVAVVTAVLTLAVWVALVGESFVFALTLAITVLVIACPHALGLAIPTVTTIATSLAVKNGLFVKNLAKMETIKKVSVVVFDKTGTLTKGTFSVTEVVTFGAVSGDDVVRLTASLEQHSSHSIGQSVVRYAKAHGSALIQPERVTNYPGKGIGGFLDGMEYLVGNRTLMEAHGVRDTSAFEKAQALSVSGGTVLFLASGKKVLGVIILADEIKEESRRAVAMLRAMEVRVAMLTGDNAQVAERVASALGIETYFAEVLPERKYMHIRELQKNGAVVLMVGDGVNDAPALSQADVGVAIGAGTDVAVEAGDVVLLRDNPEDVARLIILARKVYTKMVQNLLWALGYNVLAIPAAAGAFAAWGVFLRPEVGAFLMSMSTVAVVANAMLLKRVNLQVH